MGKNVIVLDGFEHEIGRTYPKRARGLVRNGRAEYAGDCKIRLLEAHAPTSDFSENVEDNAMSIVIDFNAREFSFDPSCENNVGSRMFISNEDGSSIEAFELGDWEWAWSQIKSERTLERDTDYVFRFAVTGGYNDTNDAVSRFIMVPDDCWEDRYVYQLSQSAFKPVLSKRNPADGGLLRIYEIPFQTGKHESWRFVFAAQHAAARFMPAGELGSYASFEDYTYEAWWQDRREQMKQGRGKNDSGNSSDMNLDLSGAVISEQALYNLLAKVGSSSGRVNLDLSGACVSDNGDLRRNVPGMDSDMEEGKDKGNSALQRIGLKTTYDAIKLYYDSLPDDSDQKKMLETELETLKEELEASAEK